MQRGRERRGRGGRGRRLGEVVLERGRRKRGAASTAGVGRVLYIRSSGGDGVRCKGNTFAPMHMKGDVVRGNNMWLQKQLKLSRLW